MRKVEDLVNWFSDLDWGWWPFLYLRPQKHQKMDTAWLIRLTLYMGGPISGIGGWLLVTAAIRSLSIPLLAICLATGVVFFFLGYKFTFALCWNRRAARIVATSPG